MRHLISGRLHHVNIFTCSVVIQQLPCLVSLSTMYFWSHWAYLIQAESQGLCSRYLQMTKSQIYFNLSLTWNLMSFYWHSRVDVNIFLVSALWVPAEPLGPRSTNPTAHFSDKETKVCRENVAIAQDHMWSETKTLPWLLASHSVLYTLKVRASGLAYLF